MCQTFVMFMFHLIIVMFTMFQINQYSKDTQSDSCNNRKSKKKEKAAENANATDKMPGDMGASAVTLGDAKINKRRDLSNPVMVMDNISDVRVKYHINPKGK